MTMVSPHYCTTQQTELKSVVYDTEIMKQCVEWIRKHALEKVCLQFPDDLLSQSVSVALRIEELLQQKVYILGDTTAGSCCVDEIAANHIAADGIIHFGHACLNPTSRLPTFHVLPRSEIDISTFLDNFRQFFTNPDEKLLLFYDVSFAHAVEPIWNILRSEYPNLMLTHLKCTSNVPFVDAKNDEAVTSGRTWTLEQIHDYQAIFLGPNAQTLASLALSISTKSWHYSEGDKFSEFTVINNLWLRRRRFLVEKLKDAQIVGIVVATLGIKDYLKILTSIKGILKKNKKKVYVFSVGKPNPAKLANFLEIDAFIIIACPENDIFNSREFLKPILTPYEVELAFNHARLFSTHYCLDFRQILPGGSNYMELVMNNGPDVSLITGTVRYNDDSEVVDSKMSALVCKNDGTVAIGKDGADFLLNRSWQGLEQQLGETEVKKVEQGRRGLPVNYDCEPLDIKLS